MEIDLVYTWVNGNDPKFIEKKNKYNTCSSINLCNPHERFDTINELIYSIDTVLKFIPWIRYIFIVTDNQLPPLTKQQINTHKIKIITHDELIPHNLLPVYFSDVIESYLHNIPGLSEIFLYNNDDCMHFNTLLQDDIIQDNKIKAINTMDIEIIKTKTSEYSKRILLTHNILKNIDDLNFYNNHHTKILRKSTLKYIENNYRELLDNLRSHRFRVADTIQYLYFAINIDMILNGAIITQDKTDVLEYHFGQTNYDEKYKNRFDSSLIKRAKFVCYNTMNDTYADVFKGLVICVLHYV